MLVYQNYHRHTFRTNPLVPDSTVSNEDYCKRAVELGHGIISSCEHGYQGNIFECYRLAKQYDLKFLFAAEAYMVKNRFEADKTNAHIILAALNETGRKDITRILSEANKTGFYGRPRIDMELLLSLKPENVVITSACVGGLWKYEDYESLFVQIHAHFGSHFYLEVQYHNTQSQIELNYRIQQLSRQYGIELMMGCDSHYIFESQAKERDDFLKSKAINYPDESGWFMGYPDGDTAYQRFVDQGVLSHAEIMSAMENTNIFLQVEEYDSPIFNTDIKMPTLYPDWTQDQIDEEYKRIVWKEWERYKPTLKLKREIPADLPDEIDVPSYIEPYAHLGITSYEELYAYYEKEIQSEIDTVIECHTADYFLLNYYIIKRGKELGGVLTKTGRGSAVSFFTNCLLGFTNVDRISAQIKMYPARFMSADRILKTKSLPDVDMNVADPAPFQQAQQELLGVEHAYQMIAYGTEKASGAFKLYARACGLDFDTSNTVSAQIKKYEKALQYCEDDADRELISLDDYIDPKYLSIVKESKKYQKLITSWSPAPSAYLLYSGNIEEEIGVIRIKDHLCCLLDKYDADANHFLKNDLLTVTVVKFVSEAFKEIGIEQFSINELLDKCSDPNDPVWAVYEKACTQGVNQVEQKGTAANVSKYSPVNVSELTGVIAGCRPGFKSMFKTFLSREPFSYGIPTLDNLIQTPFMRYSFMLYQEHCMAVLAYAGISMSDAYTVIKAISKKKIDVIKSFQQQFTDGFSTALEFEEGLPEDRALDTTHKVWQVIEDSSRYSYNASHAYCMALDSMYCAYLKSHYPVQFYTAYIRTMSEQSKKDKVAAAQEEAQNYFKIRFPSYRFGQDNSIVTGDPEKKEIYNALVSIKGFNKKTSVVLRDYGKNHYNYFCDLLCDLRPESITETTSKMLTKIDYFQSFGNERELLTLIDMCETFQYGNRNSFKLSQIENSPYFDIIDQYSTHVNKAGKPLKTYTLTDCREIMRQIETRIKAQHLEEINIQTRMANQVEILGYVGIQTDKEEDRPKLIVLSEVLSLLDKDGHPWGYAFSAQSMGSGKRSRWTIKAHDYDEKPFQKNQIINVETWYKRKSYFYVGKYDYVL